MLTSIPMLFILAGLAAYTVLGGADFGTGFWILFTSRQHAALRDHARHAMGPVWEANHVWLIFVLVVCWTAYPVAFASIISTLTIPLFVAAIGIILRGVAYALWNQPQAPHHQLIVERIFALSSMLTPFAMGAAIGAIASGRVPVGNAAGDLVTSWANPTSIMVGFLAVATSSYLAAVYLAADANRMADLHLEHQYRVRALIAGILTGALAVLGLAVVRFNAPRIADGLTHGFGSLMVAVSLAAGLVTLVLTWRRHFRPARVSAALAQRPLILPGLTVSQAAAQRSTLVAVIISVAAGAIVLIPSLLLLFSLFLHGHLDPGGDGAKESLHPSRSSKGDSSLKGRAIWAGLILGAGITIVADGWVQAIGVCCLCISAMFAFVLTATEQDSSPEQ
jgi:cytochrome d ubiquinol oxidase subunit II